MPGVWGLPMSKDTQLIFYMADFVNDTYGYFISEREARAWGKRIADEAYEEHGIKNKMAQLRVELVSMTLKQLLDEMNGVNRAFSDPGIDG